MRLLDRLLAFDPPPRLIVVKCEELFELLAPPGVPVGKWMGGVMPACDSSPPPRSIATEYAGAKDPEANLVYFRTALCW